MMNIDGRFSLQDRGGVSDLAAVALEADALHRLADHLGVAHVVSHQRRRLVHVVQRSHRARLRAAGAASGHFRSHHKQQTQKQKQEQEQEQKHNHKA